MEIVKIGLKCSEIQTLREVYVGFETKEDICVVFDYYRGAQYFFFIFYIFSLLNGHVKKIERSKSLLT